MRHPSPRMSGWRWKASSVLGHLRLRTLTQKILGVLMSSTQTQASVAISQQVGIQNLQVVTDFTLGFRLFKYYNEI